MNKKRLVIFGVLAVLVVAYLCPLISVLRQRSEWKRTVIALQALPRERLETAVQSFVHDRKFSSQTVPLQDLVAGGYLHAEDIRGLEGKDAQITVATDETDPQRVWVRMRANVREDTVLMMDGSVQLIARR